MMRKTQLSETARLLKRSVMRDLMKHAVDPQIISLAGGFPANDCIPVETFRASMDRVLTRDGYRALQYGPPYRPLREWLAAYMQQRGVQCEPEQVFITNGAQQGLAILSRLFCDPGDPAVIEAVTFTGVQQVTVGRRLATRTVATHLESGVEVEALEAAFRSEPRPRLAILIPNFHNPLGVSISLEKRQRIVELAARYEVPIVEDDPYSPLRFLGSAPPSMKALDTAERVFYIGSFSKMLAPAMRLGWIVAPKGVEDRVTVLRESIDLESSQLIQRAVFDFAHSGALESHLVQLNATNLRRRNAMLAALEQYLGPLGATWTKPEGGLFVWVTLPETIDSWDLFHRAIAKKVAFIPGAAFAVEGGFRNTMRLNFSNATEERLRDAVQRLAEAMEN